MPSFLSLPNRRFGPPGTQQLVRGRGSLLAWNIAGLMPTDVGFGSYQISGVSRDAQGNILPLCVAILFVTGTDMPRAKVVTEAVTGVFSFLVADKTTTHYAVFYLPGSPDVAGVTVNTLVGS